MATVDSDTGYVLEIGPDADRLDKRVQVGTKVYFSKYGAKVIKAGEDKLLIMCNDEDIIGIIEE